MTSRSPATVAISLLLLGCSSGGEQPAAAVAPPLVVREIAPAYGDPHGGKDVQITGEGFDVHAKVVVMFGDKPARAIVVAKDRIQLESPPGAAGDEVSVTVRFPDGRSGTLPMHYRWKVGD